MILYRHNVETLPKPAFHRKNVAFETVLSFFSRELMIQFKTRIFFWIFIAGLLTVIFGKVFESYVLSFYFVSMLLPVAVGTSYLFNFFLIPGYLLKKRYAKFTLYFVYLLILSTYLEMWVITGSFVLLADLNYSSLSPVVTNIFVLAIILYFIVFLKAFLLLVKRSFAIQEKSKSLKSEKNKFLKGSLTVRADRQRAKILFENIAYIESMGDYVKIITDTDEAVITRERISHLIKKLPENFLRIHRSFIVNSQKVDHFSKTDLQISKTKLPISRTYKKQVNRKLSRGDYKKS